MRLIIPNPFRRRKPTDLELIAYAAINWGHQYRRMYRDRIRTPFDRDLLTIIEQFGEGRQAPTDDHSPSGVREPLGPDIQDP